MRTKFVRMTGYEPATIIVQLSCSSTKPRRESEHRHVGLLNWRRAWTQGRSHSMHGSESASGKRQIAQFLCAFWDKQTFTRGVRVARVPQGVETAGLEVQGEGQS